MGVCATKMKEMTKGVDSEEIRMSVEGQKADIVTKANGLVAGWKQQIAGGQTVVLSPAEILPETDTNGITLKMDQTTNDKEMLATAVYVATNTIERNRIKANVWTDLAKGMKARGLPQVAIDHGQSASNPAIDAALNHLRGQMVADARAGKPLMDPNDLNQVSQYRAAHAAQANLAGPADGRNQTIPTTVQTNDALPKEPNALGLAEKPWDKPVSTDNIQVGGVAEKDVNAEPGLRGTDLGTQRYEQAQPIRNDLQTQQPITDSL